MTEFNKHTPGTFCWVDLSTTDPEGARKFYTALFNLKTEEAMPDSSMSYTLLQKNGKDIGGLGELMKEQKEMGIPSHWMSYVSVTSAKDTAAKAVSLGGTVIMEAFDVMDKGRMAVLQDPTGAAFSVWEPLTHIGTRYKFEHGSLAWNELMTKNTDQAGRFYTQLFDWKTEIKPAGEIPMEYTLFKTGSEQVGGMLRVTPEMGPIPPNWLVYFSVDEVDKQVKQAEGLGAKVMMPPTDIPKVGRFSILSDPQGAAFAMITLLPM